MRKNRRNKILFLIQLPPPVHGVGLINRMVWEDKDLLPGWDRILVKLNFSERTNQLRRFSFYKTFRYLGTWFRVLGILLFRHVELAYFSIVPTVPGFHRDLFFVLLIKIFRLIPVYHLHLMGIHDAGKKRILRFLYKWTFSNSIIIHQSESVSQLEFNTLAIKNSRIFIQSNGIEEDKHPFHSGDGQGFRIIHISHLYKFKGLDILLDVFRELIEEGQDVLLDIIGEQADPEVHDLILENLQDPLLEGRLKWHGLLTGEKKNAVLKKADIMAYTSLNDTFPLVILEAMQYGIPVIASNVGAIPEILEDQKSGILFESGNKKQLKEKIELLIANPELRKNLGIHAAEKFQNNYTAFHFRKGMHEIFRVISSYE